jgi:ferric enterobactin receptor
VSLLSANIYAEAPIGDKVTVLMAVRRSYKGFIYNLIANKYKTSSVSISNTPTQPTTGNGSKSGTLENNNLNDFL